jgi:hypothetical protein
MRTVWTGFVLAVALAAWTWAAEPTATELSPGDKVEIKWLGKPVMAEFVEYSANGWVRVKFFNDGIQMTPSLPPGEVRLLGRSKETIGTTSSNRPLRTWTDRSGKFKTKARFVELSGDELTLETSEGKKLTIALEKLSDADQAMARKVAAKVAPAPSMTGRPDEGTPLAAGPGPTPDPATTAEVMPLKLAKADWSGCRTIKLGTPKPWAVPIDSATPSTGLVAKAIPLPSSTKQADRRMFESVDGLLIARDAARAGVIVTDRDPLARSTSMTFFVVDLAEGKTVDTVPWPSTLMPVDLDPSGTQVLANFDFSMDPGATDRPIGVWKLGDRSAEAVNAWDPTPPGKFPQVSADATVFTTFVDAAHVLTLSFQGTLTMWDVAKAKAVYRIEVNNRCLPAVSPGRKQLAAVTDSGVWLFNALTGEPLGQVAGSLDHAGPLSFRPDGGQLAALSMHGLMVWDLATGDQAYDIHFQFPIASGSIDWLFGGYVLAGGTNLIDLERRVILWNYQFRESTGQLRPSGELGGLLWCASEAHYTRERVLFSAVLPHESARTMAASLDPDKVLAVRPGAKVTLDISIQGSPEEQQRVRQGLTARLEASGLVVAEGQTLVAKATTETGPSREITYRAVAKGEEKASTKPYICRLQLLDHGMKIWERTASSFAPMFLGIKEGETAQQALAIYERFPLGFFETEKIPCFIARQPSNSAYGASEVTSQGVIDASR